MSRMEYYYHLSQLPFDQQTTLLRETLESFTNDRIRKLFSSSISAEKKYVVLSALVARYVFLTSPHEIRLLNLQNVLTLPSMPSCLNPNEKRLIQDLIFDNIILTKEDVKTYRFAGHMIVDYLASLPFPLNIKCLSEAFNEKTQWYIFFKTNYANSNTNIVDCEEYCRLMIMKQLEDCNIEAFQAGKYSIITPEIATVLGRPKFIAYVPAIHRLLQENECLSPESEAWANANLTTTKDVIRQFIESIPDSHLSARYKNQGSIIQLLAMKTQLEQLGEASQQFRRRIAGRTSEMLLSWLPIHPMRMPSVQTTKNPMNIILEPLLPK